MQKPHLIRQTPGPIAEKVIRAATKLTKSKIINFSVLKAATTYQEKLQQAHQERDLSQLDPLHALFMETQHRIVDFVEQFSGLPESDKLNHTYEVAEDTYMPSGPPMSPLTRSYFWTWSALDMTVGLKKESYTSIMLDCCRAFGANPDFIKTLEHMQHSRMGLYIHEGSDAPFVTLREIFTNKIVKVLSTGQYYGVPGEIWFVQLFSDPIGNHFDYSINFTTPYVIIDLPLGQKINGDFSKLFYKEKQWIDFIERNSPAVKCKSKEKSEIYNHFMKYGREKHYWPEYVFQAYVNHSSMAIWLTGFPDKPASLPHANDNYNDWLKTEEDF